MMKMMRTLLAAFAAGALMTGVALGQAATAKMHGKVINPAGAPVNNGDVKLTTDKTAKPEDMKFVKDFPVDAQGNYTGDGIAPGDYVAFYTQGAKHVDYVMVTIKAGDDKTVDFDMTREEYMKTLSPEDRKAIEDFKAKNAATSAANKQVANLNATLTAVRTDLKAASPNYDKDIADMQSATSAKPDEGVLWVTYGDAQLAKADSLAKADKANKTAVTADAEAMKNYQGAADAYKKSTDLMEAAPKKNPTLEAAAYNQLGNTLARMGKGDDSMAAYDKAAALEPANAGMYYGNEAATLFNANNMDAAGKAADKAIAANPNNPLPYYIKGQALVQKATVDPKTQMPVAPPGCLEAYQKYLELAPDGPFAQSAKEVLAGFGQKIDTSYKAGKKK